MQTSSLSRWRSERGSVLVVAMILCAVIGISIVSYMNLSRTTMVTSNRALYSNAAMNLAENGLEEAMYALNKSVTSTYDWGSSGWTITGSGNINARRLLPTSGTYNFDQGATGQVRVFVYNYEGYAPPKLVARSTVTLGGASGRTIEKWVYVQLRKTSKFSNGLVAKNSLRFNGNNASVDSWNSDPTHAAAGTYTPTPYSSAVRDDNGSIGSISVAVGAVGVNNADIWGYAATGAGLPVVGAQGTIGPFGTSTGTMDMSHVSSDFTASFDPVTSPTTGTAIAAITSSALPTTLGTAGTTSVLRLPSITGNGGATNVLTIQGDVTLILTNTAGSSALDLTGNASIYITPGSSLKIYTAGDISLGGNGVANGGTAAGVTVATANQPASFQVWGTSTTTQNIAIAGNGALSGVVYAPNANVTINGNGDVMGSVVANNITLTGNAAFHYDESLGDFGGGNPYRVSKWQELTQATDRATYSTDLSF